MDSIVVGIIVIGAVVFSVRSFIKTYKGEKGCSCGDGCSSCSPKKSYSSDFPIINKK
ncbi:MAG: FeoB-associated Cys-rich membrane protein [Deltaproteobacteria bacterium]|nr:MAG: FeoB-associated Cys-rich membrane protein [Deltaproteobacteria bacterium]RLC25519.1 MAG: FeoB-associated Cys-rich membrane protein [Deltaproteobacteria bacterium]